MRAQRFSLALMLYRRCYAQLIWSTLASTTIFACSDAYSTLLRSILMERVMGIEPTRPAWKAGVLPLNYTRRMKIYCVDLTSMLIFDRSTVNLLLESTSSVHPQNESSLRRVTSVLTFDRCTVNILLESTSSVHPHKENLLRRFNGRDDRIRTCDPLVPNQVLYQAEPHPDNK